MIIFEQSEKIYLTFALCPLPFALNSPFASVLRALFYSIYNFFGRGYFSGFSTYRLNSRQMVSAASSGEM